MYIKFLFGLIGFLIAVKLYFIHSTKRCLNHVCLVGKTVVVTGANTGIGFHSALEFAKRGSKVILACRDRDKAETARKEIVRLSENDRVFVKIVDFSSIKSIKKCAKEIAETEQCVDVLVNNAGAGGLAEKRTKDGFDILMQINYFGPVFFTLLLLPLLKNSSKGRIINVASSMAKLATLDPDDPNQYAGRYTTYSNSKLGNILFTVKLAEKLKGSGISVFSLHPGAIKTDIFRRVSGFRKALLKFVAFFTFKEPEEGAQTIIYAATEQNIEKYSGEHFEECSVVPPYPNAIDPILADKLWLKTCELLQVDCEKIFE
ncbi:retinol dehydrogenase 11-like [Anthonomus grandis grandis]|uniref:retinol dehydrogenase 11-like n=1 Tax=Anthonomus grandis grandis TaxID=2921223 RepID=UPI0021660C34|nr:retinol dehydrogenase 11-like [Anthonomus grandis grandis]